MSQYRVVEAFVSNTIAFNAEALGEELVDEMLKAHTYKNPAHTKLRRMGYAAMNEPKYLRTAAIQGENLIVWRGCARKVRKFLQERRIGVLFRDGRVTVPMELSHGSLELRENQAPAMKEMLKKEQGLVRGATGCGKTETLLGTAIEAGQRTLVVVWNKDLLKQWADRIVKYGILKPNQIGYVGGGKKFRVGPITIGMQQTLQNEEYLRFLAPQFGTVILDECQRCSANTYHKVINWFPAKYRFGGSADEKRRDRKEFLIYDTFGEVLHEIESGETTIEPELVIVPTDYEDGIYEQEKNYTPFINLLVRSPTRNQLIAGVLREQLKEGRKILLFTERRDAAEYWRNVVREMGFESGLLMGGDDAREETERTIHGLQKGFVQFAAATSYADVGLDIPVLDTAFITCPVGDIKRANQMIGRIVRHAPGKKDARAFYFWDRMVYGIAKKVTPMKKRWPNWKVKEF